MLSIAKNTIILTGVEDIHCRVIHSSYALLSNIILQIQESALTEVISGIFKDLRGRYTKVLQVVSASLAEPDEA